MRLGTITSTIRTHLAETAIAAGGTALLVSLATNSAPQAAAGVALIVLGAVGRARRMVERVISDTSRERERLQREQEAAQAGHMQYVAARAVLDREQENLCEQMAEAERKTAETLAAELIRLHAVVEAEREALRSAFEAEREALLTDVENRKAALKKEGWVVGYDAGQRGILDIHEPTSGAVVIPMPLPAVGSDTTTGKGHLS